MYSKTTQTTRLKEKMTARIEKVKSRAKKSVEKAKQPSLVELKKKAQKIVNAYVRERDKDLPCISCGKMAETWQAGHYIAQGSSGFLRFNLENINKQCVSCNMFKHGNLIEYRRALVDKIGSFRVEGLEAFIHATKKWTREELEEIITKHQI